MIEQNKRLFPGGGNFMVQPAWSPPHLPSHPGEGQAQDPTAPGSTKELQGVLLRTQFNDRSKMELKTSAWSLNTSQSPKKEKLHCQGAQGYPGQCTCGTRLPWLYTHRDGVHTKNVCDGLVSSRCG